MFKRACLVLCIGLTACGKKDGEWKDYPDTVDGLKAQIGAMVELIKKGDLENAEVLANQLSWPGKQEWIKAHFPDGTLGMNVAQNLPPPNGEPVVKFFKKALDDGKTEVAVVRLESPDDKNGNAYQLAAIQAMGDKKVPLYTVRMVKPGESIGSSLWSFVHVDGAFRWVGKMKQVKPDGSPFDELPVKEVEAATSR